MGKDDFDISFTRNIKILLRIVRSDSEYFSLSASGRSFVHSYGIGGIYGSRLKFSIEDKKRISDLLESQGVSNDIDPNLLTKSLTRAGSLEMSHDEKRTSICVKRRTMLVKPMPGNGFLLADGKHPVRLPIENSSLLVDVSADDSFCYTSVIVVENWECFDRFHQLHLIDFSRAGDNPIILWRGDGSPESNASGAYDFLRRSEKKVFAFVDYDPSGLCIALGLPGLSGVLLPDETILRDLVRTRGNEKLYEKQQNSIKQLQKVDHPDIVKIRRTLDEFGKGLPQETFLMKEKSLRLG